MTIESDRQDSKKALPQQYLDLYEFLIAVRSMLNNNKYIAHSDYAKIVKRYKSTIDFYNTIEKSDLLEEYCLKHGVSSRTILNGVKIYNSLDDAVKQFNEKFVNENPSNDDSGVVIRNGVPMIGNRVLITRR